MTLTAKVLEGNAAVKLAVGASEGRDLTAWGGNSILYSRIDNGRFYMITRPEMLKEKNNGFD